MTIPLPPSGTIDLTKLTTYGPQAIGVDGSGNVYLVDTGTNRVLMFGANGEFISSISTLGSGPAQVKQPVSIAPGLRYRRPVCYICLNG